MISQTKDSLLKRAEQLANEVNEMKLFILVTTYLFMTFSNAGEANLYDYSLELTNGEKMELSSLKGKTVLIANIATRCGYTGQLDDLEKLYEKYKAKGFVLIGIPSNDFGGQTPEDNKEVAKFCRLKYGATFPIATKTVVKGERKSALVKFLVANGGEIAWNFEKFLISKDGTVVERFKSGVEPLSSDLTKKIESVL